MSSSETERLGEDDRRTLELLAVGLSGAVSRAAEFRAKRDQLEALARFEAVFANAVTGMMLVALGGPIVAVNPALEALIGRPACEIEGRGADEFVHPDDREAAVASARSVLKGEARTTLEHRYVRADGGIVWVEASLAKVDESDASTGFIVAMVQDITQRRVAEEALRAQAELNEHQALHDALTGLANRTLFRDRIEQSLHRARRSRGGGVAVLMLDLDRFKEVNDSLGHAAGDALLVELSRRLDGMLRASDTIARLGGDEFGVLLPDPSSVEDVMTAAERVRAAIQEPVIVHGLPLSVDASIGIALFPRDGVDVETLLQHADVAMYHAKHENAGCALYEASRHDGDPLRLTLVGTRGSVLIDSNEPHLEVYCDEEPVLPPIPAPEDPMAFWRSSQLASRARPKGNWVPLQREGGPPQDAARFLDCVEQGRDADVTARDGAALVETLMAAYVSAHQGEPVVPAAVDWPSG